MALDRQRILTELGSVVNQLQRADCGCMGKLFNNPGQSGQIPMGNPLPTCGGCRRGCCHGHGYGGWNSGRACGDPYTMNNQEGVQSGNAYTMNNQQCIRGQCMERCNPPKLYADTYNYLAENLMQPTIKEVYTDLSSITPANTLMNNPMANQMLGVKDAFAAKNNSDGDSQFIGVPTNNITNFSNNMELISNNVSPSNAMGNISGMGPQIMNMLGSNQVSKPSTIQSDIGQGGNRLTGSMVIDAPQSPHGAVGVTPLSAPMRNKEAIYPNNNMFGHQNYNQYEGDNNMMGTNITNTFPNSQNVQGSQNTSNMKTNPAAQQMDSSQHHRHGLHQQGIAKFNEMFPGVMKGMGGNLNFDPMAMAIQMNPANHHQTAMDTMNKIMSNNNAGLDKTGHTNASPKRPGTAITNNSNIPLNQSNLPQVQNVNSAQLKNPNIIPDQNSNQYKTISEKNHEIYTALTPQPKSQYQMRQQNLQTQQYNTQQLTVDSNSGNVIPSPRLPTLNDGALGNQNDLSKAINVVSEEPENQKMIKEPIFPADTLKSYIPQQKYNTLGQPIEMLPAQVYHTQEPALPQTLSPQPQIISNNPAKFSMVKSTISKTSLMGTKAIDRTTSKSQLQQIYNQYKGSQSYTRHNVRAPDNGASYSDGNINIPRTNVPAVQQNIPIERINGDALYNNQIQDHRTNKIEQVMGQKGDVSGVMKPSGNVTNAQVTNKKTRNGLQDQVYTSYPTSAAWSFHGDRAPRYSTGYRDRYRV